MFPGINAYINLISFCQCVKVACKAPADPHWVAGIITAALRRLAVTHTVYCASVKPTLSIASAGSFRHFTPVFTDTQTFQKLVRWLLPTVVALLPFLPFNRGRSAVRLDSCPVICGCAAGTAECCRHADWWEMFLNRLSIQWQRRAWRSRSDRLNHLNEWVVMTGGKEGPIKPSKD